MPREPLPPERASEPAPAKPASLSLAIADIGDLSRLFSSWDGRIEQVSRGRFRGAIHVLRGRELRVFRAESNQALQGRGHDGPGLVSFAPVTTANGQSLWQGRRLPPGSVVLRGAGCTLDNRPARNSVNYTLQVPLEALRRAGWTLGRLDLRPERISWEVFEAAPGLLPRLENTLVALLQAGSSSPEALAGPSGRVLEANCLQAAVELLAQRAPRGCDGLAPPARSVLVLRAEEFMRSRLREPLSALDLCAELGACGRTLRLAFRERFGMGPLAYFRVLRLNAVRAALLAARGGDEGVAGLVRRWGFTRLGAFAAEYRLQFGESPSLTLGVRGEPGQRGAGAGRG